MTERAAPTMPAAPAVRAAPGRPKKLSHAAYITHDTAATAAFYTELLGMEMVAAVMDDKIPSTGDPVPYFHSFFRMQDGSTVAFFEAPELPPAPDPSHPAYDVFRHLALEVESPAVVDSWHDWLVGNGVEVLGPVDHKIIYSIYFHDPNGLRLELTAPVDPTWNDQGAKAKESLTEWEEVKRAARADGRGMLAALTDLTTRRSHQASTSPEPLE